MANSLNLLSSPRFRPFFLTQLLGAFNDNLYKNALTILIAFQAAGMTQQQSNVWVNLAAALFILPFFLFSALGGQLADRYEKGMLIRRIKLLEILIMLFGAAAFLLQDLTLLVAILFLMGTQSALFGPVKYSLLPQALEPEELVGGNAMVEFGTFLAILIGLIAGVYLMSVGVVAVSLAVLLTAVAGYWTSRAIPALPSAAPNLKISFNILGQTLDILRESRSNRVVFYSILGISWFWFVGFTYITQLPNYVRFHLGGDEQVYVWLLAMFSIGIGAGSFLCERLSGRLVEIGLVPIGALGLTVFGIDLYFGPGDIPGEELRTPAQFLSLPGSLRIYFDIFMLGAFGGLYIVPLYALIQQRSDPARCARVIAANNIINALFMVAAPLYGVFALSLGVSVPGLFLIMALMNAAVALFIFLLVPEFVMRLIVWLLLHTVYRVDDQDLDKIPDDGPALLICNHVSFVDALVLIGRIRRPIRFVMYYRIFDIPVLSFVFKTAGAIPIASAKEDVALRDRAFDQVAQALDEGELVCIFPEGQLTGDGQLSSFKPGVLHILERNPVPVVPLALRGLWGSFFSRAHGKAMSRPFPRGLWNRIELVAGEVIRERGIGLETMQQRVLALRGDRL